MRHDGFDNDTERRFAGYLDSRGYAYERHPSIGGLHPDFLVRAPGADVVCEVIQFAQPATFSSGWRRDPHGFVRRGIQAKVRQGRGAKSVLPYVVVVGREGLAAGPLDDISITGAMFGDLGVSWQVDTATGQATDAGPSFGFHGGGRLQENLNTRISAVLHPRHFNPTERPVQDRLDRKKARRPEGEGFPAGVATTMRVYSWAQATGLKRLVAKALGYPHLDADARAPRAVTYHNPYASTPLPLDVFAGPFDEQHGAVGGWYGVASQGLRVPDLPR